MKRACVLLALVPVLLLAADESVSVSLRGKAQSMPHLQPPGGAVDVTVIFLPGDGGWRGVAVSMAKTIASWGYEVYGFDTKKYLEAFSQDGAKLSRDQLAGDMRRLTEQVGVISKKLVILVGWSQGAGMAVAAVSGGQARSPIHGVITLGLPESAVLGWDWKATLAIVARRDPDQPTFPVKPLLGNIAPTPIWMIHGSEDEYTTPETARELFQAVSAPKQLREIGGANHRFDGHPRDRDVPRGELRHQGGRQRDAAGEPRFHRQHHALHREEGREVKPQRLLHEALTMSAARGGNAAKSAVVVEGKPYTYGQLLDYSTFADWLGYSGAVATLFYYRKLQNEAPAFRAPGFPILPGIFVLVTLATVVSNVIASPRDAGMALLIALIGVPVYFYWTRVHRK